MAEPPREPHVRAASFGRQEHAGDEITGERLMSGQGRKRATASANARWTAAPIVKTGRSGKPRVRQPVVRVFEQRPDLQLQSRAANKHSYLVFLDIFVLFCI